MVTSARRQKAVARKAAAPRVSLYLRDINQEQIRFRGSAAGCDIYGSWTKSCCILDFKKLRPGEKVINPLKGMLLRAEGTGGMMWNPNTGSVHKLNDSAYHAVLDIEAGRSVTDVAARNSLTHDAVKDLVTKLKKIAE